MKIFLTGATGFIGSYVAQALLSEGHELVVLARNPDKHPALSNDARVERILGTLADSQRIRKALTGADACVHVALGWGDTPTEMLKNDTLASVSLLEACLDAGVRKFIYTSSTAALGSFFERMDETHPTRPSDLYGATKAATEAYVLAVGAKSGMLCNVIRPGYTFGNPVAPGATTQPDRRFHHIVRQARRGEDITLKRGDGTQFIWAGDLARLYTAVLASERTREVYYGLGAPFVEWQRIAEQAIEITGSNSQIHLEGSTREPCLFDLGKMRRHFGLEFDSATHIREHLVHLASLPLE
ncbi:MAG: NAD-dependent epimerase/dehydratase family protein [Myxococcota bacterium]